MKRVFCLFLCILLLLSGCGFTPEEQGNTVFYYCRTEYSYDGAQAVIVPERREISENASDLKNLLALYLVGPLSEGLTTPFLGTKLISANEENGHLLIKLTNPNTPIGDAQFSLACACVSMTFLELTDLTQVTVVCGDRTATMSQDNLLLYDSITSTENIPEESQ